MFVLVCGLNTRFSVVVEFFFPCSELEFVCFEVRVLICDCFVIGLIWCLKIWRDLVSHVVSLTSRVVV